MRLHRRVVPWLVLVLICGCVAWGSAAGGVFHGPAPAAAEVEHGQGFAAVVDGYRSWYGSYRLGELGEVWCVDHGIAAPDAALGYEPTGLEDHAPETRRAVAWAVGRWGVGADRVTAAALMLVLHDLMGAVYPSGRLSVEGLTRSELVGFEGMADEVLATARSIKADAVARAGLVGPLSMAVTAEGDGVGVAGRVGRLQAMVADADGSPIGGVLVHPAVTGAALLGDVDVVTADDGVATWSFESGPGENRFALSATVPGADLVALRPSRGSAQRVARPAAVVVEGSAGFSAVVPRTFTILKRGDAQPTLGVAGARFSVSGVNDELVVGADGRTPPLTLLPGSYTVTEVVAPPGYEVAGPWTVVVADADVVLEVQDPARRGGLEVSKVDAVTGAPVAGATFAVRGDIDADPSVYEVEVADWMAPLLVGRYEVREVAPPPHYRGSAAPVVVEVRAGERTAVVVPNTPLATMAFRKRPPLAGATFAVRSDGDGGPEVGRCTTGTDGGCTLPDDVLDGGRTYCWSEVEAPAGWGLADGACARTGAAGSVTTIDVDEHPLPPPPAPAPAPPAPAPAAQPTPAAVTPEETTEAPSPITAPEAPTERPTAVLSTPTMERPPELPRTGGSAARLAPPALGLVGVGLLLLAAGLRPARRDQGEGSQLVG